MKILVSSDCNGNLQTLFTKVNQLHTKNNFDCLFLIGNVLDSKSGQAIKNIISKQLKISLPTFFIDSSPMGQIIGSLYPQGNDIVQNFHFLGNYGITKFKDLTIAYLNGKEMPLNQYHNLSNKNISKITSKYNNYVIQKFIKEAEKYYSIDILLTNQWPFQFTENNNINKSLLISKLVDQISPRYHFAAGGGQFYRMDAYQNRKGNASHFINVAPITSDQPTGKYLFAVKIQPQPQNQILKPNPFNKSQKMIIENQQGMNYQQKLKNAKKMVQQSQKRIGSKQTNQPIVIDKNTHLYFQNFPQQSKNHEITQFLQRWGQLSTIQIFDPKKHKRSGVVKFRDQQSTKICLADSGRYSWRNQRIRFQISKIGGRVRDDQCWFCLGTKVFDQNLMICKGQNLYIGMDKGPISSDHLQIVPFSHQNDFKRLSKDQIKQIQMVRNSFQKYYVSKNKTLISYSRYANLAQNINHYVQFIVPHDLPQQKLIQSFYQINNRDKLWFKQLTPKSVYKKQKYHTVLTIGKTSFIKELEKKDRKDISRQIVCILFENYAAMNWKEVQMSNEKIKKEKERLSQLAKIILNS